MWMDRLTAKQVDQVGMALETLRSTAGNDAEVSRTLNVNQAHLSQHKNNKVITPTLFAALVDMGLVSPIRPRVRLSADLGTIEQRDRCHTLARCLGFRSWSSYVRFLGSSAALQQEVFKVAKMCKDGMASPEHLLSVVRMSLAAMEQFEEE